MRPLLWRIGLCLFALVALVACGQPQQVVTHDGPIRDHVSFVDQLRARGLTVEPVGSVQQPFLQAETSTRLRISGGDLEQPAELQSFDYEDASTAAADVEKIGPDGNPRTAIVEWVGPPHWFHKEQLIVLYVGDDQAVLDLLTELLGPQFAGQ